MLMTGWETLKETPQQKPPTRLASAFTKKIKRLLWNIAYGLKQAGFGSLVNGAGDIGAIHGMGRFRISLVKAIRIRLR